MELFTAIVPLSAIAAINENSSRKERLRNIILDNIRKLIKDKRIEEEHIFAILGQDLLIWQDIFSIGNSSESIQNAVIESLLDTWHGLSSSSTNITALEYVPPQICIVIHQNKKGINYCRLTLVCLLRIMQSNTDKSGPSIMNAILPSLLLILNDTSLDESYELVVVQIIFFAFNLVDENKRDLLVGLILIPLINVMSNRSSASMTNQFLGKCLTHLARTYQETFRLQVSLLNDTQRQVLQEAMRNVLQQQQQQQIHEQNQQGSSSNASIKKIDLTKFKTTHTN